MKEPRPSKWPSRHRTECNHDFAVAAEKRITNWQDLCPVINHQRATTRYSEERHAGKLEFPTYMILRKIQYNSKRSTKGRARDKAEQSELEKTNPSRPESRQRGVCKPIGN